MLRGTLAATVVRAFATLAILSIVAGLLLACGEEENGNGGGGQPTATPTSVPATPTPTTQPPVPPSPTTTPDRIDHPIGKDATIVRITSEGGFAPPNQALFQMPLFVLDGRGCVITQGPMIEIYPQPALPNLLETCLQEEGTQYILAAAKDAGLLDGDAHYPYDMIADAPTTVFTINAGGESSVISVYALGLDDTTPPGMSKEDAAARAKLAEFMMMMQDWRSWMPEGSIVTEERFFEIERLQVVSQPVSSPSAPVPDAGIEPGKIAWPLATPLAEFGDEFLGNADLRCDVIEGEDLGLLLRVMENANTLTNWTSDDESYYLYLRPLTAGEVGCEILDVPQAAR